MNLRTEIEKLNKIAISKIVQEPPEIEICGVCPITKEIASTFIMGKEDSHRETEECKNCEHYTGCDQRGPFI